MGAGIREGSGVARLGRSGALATDVGGLVHWHPAGAERLRVCQSRRAPGCDSRQRGSKLGSVACVGGREDLEVALFWFPQTRVGMYILSRVGTRTPFRVQVVQDVSSVGAAQVSQWTALWRTSIINTFFFARYYRVQYILSSFQISNIYYVFVSMYCDANCRVWPSSFNLDFPIVLKRMNG